MSSIDVFLKLMSELYLLFALIVKSHDNCERALLELITAAH